MWVLRFFVNIEQQHIWFPNTVFDFCFRYMEKRLQCKYFVVYAIGWFFCDWDLFKTLKPSGLVC